MSTPRASVSLIISGEIVLQSHRQSIMHVHLDGDQQKLAHTENRNFFQVDVLCAF